MQLREAIMSRLRDPSVPDEQLRVVLREVATEARSRSLRPESLIIALKRVMAEVETTRASYGSDEPRKLQEWLVTTCIQSYFDRERADGDPS